MKTSTLTCIVLLCSAASVQPPKWATVENWRLKLEPYMTTHQIRLLLGDPIDREVSWLAQIWYYEKGPPARPARLSKGQTPALSDSNDKRPSRAPIAHLPSRPLSSSASPNPTGPTSPGRLQEQTAAGSRAQAQAALKKRKAAEEQRLRAMKEREAFAEKRQQQLEAA